MPASRRVVDALDRFNGGELWGLFLYDVYTVWTYNKLVEAQRLAIIFVSRAQLIYNKTRLC